MNDRKYRHLTSGKNYNNVTVSVPDSVAPKVNAAISYLMDVTGKKKSQVICEAILVYASDMLIEQE